MRCGIQRQLDENGPRERLKSSSDEPHRSLIPRSVYTQEKYFLNIFNRNPIRIVNYPFPIDLAPDGIQFGAKSI